MILVVNSDGFNRIKERVNNSHSQLCEMRLKLLNMVQGDEILNMKILDAVTALSGSIDYLEVRQREIHFVEETWWIDEAYIDYRNHNQNKGDNDGNDTLPVE